MDSGHLGCQVGPQVSALGHLPRPSLQLHLSTQTTEPLPTPNLPSRAPGAWAPEHLRFRDDLINTGETGNSIRDELCRPVTALNSFAETLV